VRRYSVSLYLTFEKSEAFWNIRRSGMALPHVGLDIRGNFRGRRGKTRRVYRMWLNAECNIIRDLDAPKMFYAAAREE
jgi:hypothetical protein